MYAPVSEGGGGGGEYCQLFGKLRKRTKYMMSYEKSNGNLSLTRAGMMSLMN